MMDKFTKITITGYKDTNLMSNVHDLFGKKDMTDEESEKLHDLTTKVFEYGEFLDAEIIVDQNFDIVGGRIIPFKYKK